MNRVLRTALRGIGKLAVSIGKRALVIGERLLEEELESQIRNRLPKSSPTDSNHTPVDRKGRRA